MSDLLIGIAIVLVTVVAAELVRLTCRRQMNAPLRAPSARAEAAFDQATVPVDAAVAS